MKTRTNNGAVIDLEDEPCHEKEEPLSLLKAHLETLAIGDHRIDEIARAIGMKDQIVYVAKLLRRLEGRVFESRAFSSRNEGRRRLFTISAQQPKV